MKKSNKTKWIIKFFKNKIKKTHLNSNNSNSNNFKII